MAYTTSSSQSWCEVKMVFTGSTTAARLSNGRGEFGIGGLRRVRVGSDEGDDERDYDEQVDHAERNVGVAPADVYQRGCERGDDDELAERVAGHCGAGGGAPAPHEPAAYQDADGSHGGAAVADGEYDAVEQDDLPLGLGESHEADADGGDDCGDRDDRADAEAVNEPADEGHGDGGDYHEAGGGEGERGAAEFEVFAHRLQEQAEGEAGAAAEEQHGEPGCQDDPAVFDAAQC